MTVGHARWYFLIDGDDVVHRTTHKIAASIMDGSVAPEWPHRDIEGVLLASVGIALEDGVPSAISELSLFPLAAREEGKGRAISPISPGVADNLCGAIREKLNRRKVRRLDRIEEASCAELKAQIAAGRYAGWVYEDLLGTERQRMYHSGRGSRIER